MSEKQQNKTFLEEFSHYYPDPGNYVAESYSPEFLQSLAYQPYAKLIVIADALAQFVAHIRFYANQENARLSFLRGQYEQKISDIMVAKYRSKELTDRTPSQARNALVMESDPELKSLHQEILKAEQKARMFDYMPDAIREHLNVLKLEIKTRQERKAFD